MDTTKNSARRCRVGDTVLIVHSHGHPQNIGKIGVIESVAGDVDFWPEPGMHFWLVRSAGSPFALSRSPRPTGPWTTVQEPHAAFADGCLRPLRPTKRRARTVAKAEAI